MTAVVSAWPSHPGYRIDLTPVPGTVRIWHGELLLVATDRALLVEETDHAAVYYVPESDVQLELFAPTEHHTICPFKGEADYLTLTAASTGQGDPENIAWRYLTPFDEVAGLTGYLSFYADRTRLELPS
jgi:acyl-CoA thioesterase-2